MGIWGAVLMLSIAGACGDDNGGGDEVEDADATVVVENSAFTPAEVRAKANDVVRWEFKDAFDHTVTAEDGAFDSKPTKAPNLFEFVATSPGTFKYKCTIHPSMTGTLVIE